MSDGYKSATEWKQGISAALGVRPGGWNYSLDGAVEKIEDLMRDSAARERERARAANSALPEPDATNPDHLRWCADIVDLVAPNDALDPIALRSMADRLDATRSAEREREQRIEAAAKSAYEHHEGFVVRGDGKWQPWDQLSESLREGWRSTVVAAGLLRGGGRGE